MTVKFNAFIAALEALCVEHGVRVRGGDEYDDYGVYVEEASDERPAGLALELDDCIPLTPEERAQEDARRSEEQAQWAARVAEYQAADEKRYAEVLASGDYIALQAAIETHAMEIRKRQMRVSNDPNDPAYIDDRPRRVWVNDREVIGWIVADEFRRCAITPTGVINGAVLIERLPGDAPEPVAEPVSVPINSLSGIFEYVPDTPKSAAPAEHGTLEDCKPKFAVDFSNFPPEPAAPVDATPTYAAPMVKVEAKPAAQPKHKHGKRRR